MYSAIISHHSAHGQKPIKCTLVMEYGESEDCPGFETFGEDVKEARKVRNISRKDLAEQVNIDTRYLANIENEGTIPSLPVIIQLAEICGLPMERYFDPQVFGAESPQRTRVRRKLEACPEEYLPIAEGVLDGILQVK